MDLKARVERRLKQVESELEEQMARCCQHGFDTHHALFLDGRLIERHTLRWVLGKKRKPFNAADCMAGW